MGFLSDRELAGLVPADEAAFLAAASELGGGDLSGYLRELVHTTAPKSLALASSSLE